MVVNSLLKISTMLMSCSMFEIKQTSFAMFSAVFLNIVLFSYAFAANDDVKPARAMTPAVVDCGKALTVQGVAQSPEQHARILFEDFLARHKAERGEIDDAKIKLADFFPESAVLPKLSQFNSGGDTLLYGKLISTLLKRLPVGSIHSLIDLGAGSSIPTIKALLENPQHSTIKVLAVDIDKVALEVSQSNARDFGLSARYSFLNSNLIDFLAKTGFDSGQILASNPPYLPVPENVTDPKYIPVGAGVDGTKYIEQVLGASVQSGTHVVIAWGSLTNPARLIPLIEKNYEVLFVQAYDTAFGVYTSSDVLLPHIQKQSQNGAAVFTTHADGKRSYTVVGTILRRK